MIQLEQIPPLRGPRPEGSTPAPPATRKAPRQNTTASASGRVSRRSILSAAIASGTALGFSLLGAFPAAKRAYADGYDIWTGPCPAYAANHNCSPGCGPSVVEFASCASSGYHKNGVEIPGILSYSLWPNNCYPGVANWADGWMWSQSSCLGCLSLDFRCHDGRTTRCTTGRGGSCSSWISICRWITRCSSV